MNLQYFNDQDFYSSIKIFFEDLNIPIHYITEQPASPKEILSNNYKPNHLAHQLVDDVYFLGMVDDRAFNKQPSIIDNKQLRKKEYDGLLIFGVTLDRSGGKLPTRGQMAEITRAFNREFHYTPVVIVFRYNQYISFSNCERAPYKQKWREGEKAGKVSLLKDINTIKTHTGHLKILENLTITTTGKKAVTTFDDLYNYWQEVFSVSLLSKQFYRELSNWYFWALQHVEFPDDAEKDREVKNATSVIRLITRLMFVWFLKEKNLIPGVLFDTESLDDYLNYTDSNNSTYYKAILQNLFFATLNTKMKKDDPQSRKFVNRQYGIQEFYRYERFFKDKKKALKLFETIPFLNGGLFENLDKNIGKPDETRIDCFSNRPVHEKKLKVPDFLFFGDEDQIDLSEIYGSKKRKNETVRGIIHILNSYKFTIAENTPIEEEIALDPELLGKVFENLLASYNPETQTTARKQTGSFYTPRVIVNYMVDESLIAYLEGKLIEVHEKEHGFIQKTPPSQKSLFGKQKPVQTKIAPSQSKLPAGVKKEINDKLHNLLSYSTEDHLFSKKEVKVIITALDNAKILDPACGSGAFPMGILHKMVHILSKLDPQNKQWKQRQIENQTREVKKDISYAEKIKDDKARQKALNELEERLSTINDAFDNNELDFGRKLYLIENCIFGVDIQPIAVQISKLRFFISLIVDQKDDEKKENLGVLPLPNLETRFAAANTLIGIEKKRQMEFNFQNPEINKKEKELAKVRERHFSARTPNTKEKYRQKDENLRNEIAILLEKDGFASDATRKLANWNPYDQNTSADFFDMEWMFGVKDGFDVVLGNPPYLGFHGIKKSIKNDLKKRFLSANGKFDYYIPFIEKGFYLLKQKGYFIFICPTSFTKREHGTNIRKFLLKHTSIRQLVDFEHKQMFDNVTNYTGIFSFIKYPAKKNIIQYKLDLTDEYSPISQQGLKESPWIFLAKNYSRTVEKIREKIPLGEIADISEGIVTGLNSLYLKKKNEMLQLDFEDKYFFKCFRGREIDRYCLQDPSESIFYPYKLAGTKTVPVEESVLDEECPNYMDYLRKNIPLIMKRKYFVKSNKRWYELWNQRKIANFTSPKILTPELSEHNRFTIADSNTFYGDTACGIIRKEEYRKYFKMRYLLSVLNSSVIEWLYKKTTVPKAGGFFIYKVMFLKNISIPEINISKQEQLISPVDKILATKKSNPSKDTTLLEAEIDGRVAHLYNLNEEEYSMILKETNCPDPFRVAALNIYRDIARGKTK